MPARAREGHLEMKALAVLLALAAQLALAAEDPVRLDSAPIDPRDVASLQSGARSFVNYCLNCHSAGMMRYHKLLDLGLTEQQVKENLLFTTDKIGELMNVAMARKDAKEWLGTAPPRSEEHTSELQSPCNLVCRLLLEKKKRLDQQFESL